MVAPLALVADVHPLFALAAGDHDRAVQVDHRLGEELRRLPLPDVEAGNFNGQLQIVQALGRETAAEVAGRGRIGDRLGPQGVEKDFVVAAQFDVLQARRVAERVQRQVQDMIGLVIGQMHFQQMQVLVDGFDQPTSWPA
jgi:hypothetical protein